MWGSKLCACSGKNVRMDSHSRLHIAAIPHQCAADVRSHIPLNKDTLLNHLKTRLTSRAETLAVLLSEKIVVISKSIVEKVDAATLIGVIVIAGGPFA